MHLIYIDDSWDDQCFIYSALAVDELEWANVFVEIQKFRKLLKRSCGIYVYKELHATEFVAGRGRPSPRIIPKGLRCQIFMDMLHLLASLKGVSLFNVCLPPCNKEWAFDRLLNRINRTMQSWNSRAFLICDKGRDTEITRLVRKMSIHNPIPSQFGLWIGSGHSTRNIPIDRIIEDPVFKSSEKSYLIQAADFCAYSLLRREHPLPSKTRYGLDKAFNILKPILVQAAHPADPDGIIR